MAAAYTRLASHASGSPHPSAGWYEGDGALLSSSLSSLLSAADYSSPAAPATAAVRAVIAPHAGLRYSGATAAFAYRRLCPLPAGTRRIVEPVAVRVRLPGHAISALSRPPLR